MPTPIDLICFCGALLMVRTLEGADAFDGGRNTKVVRSLQAPLLRPFLSASRSEHLAAWSARWTAQLLKDRRRRYTLHAGLVGLAVTIVLLPTTAAAAQAAARLVFASVASVECYALWSGFGWHNAFVFFYLSWVCAAPCGVMRDLMLRVVVVHSYASAGAVKLRVGGLVEWCRGATLRATLTAYRGRGTSPLVERLLSAAPDTVLGFIGLGTVVLECAIVPALLLFDGPLYRCFVALSVAGFHLGIAASTGIGFTAHLTLVLLALLPMPPPDYFSLGGSSNGSGSSFARPGGCFWAATAAAAAPPPPPTTTTTTNEQLIHLLSLLPAVVLCFGGLVWATLRQLEGYPLNAVSIFPFNARQIKCMQEALCRQPQGESTVADAETEAETMAAAPLRLVVLDDALPAGGHKLRLSWAELRARDLLALATSMEAGLPSVYTPGFHAAVDWPTLEALGRTTTTACQNSTSTSTGTGTGTANAAIPGNAVNAENAVALARVGRWSEVEQAGAHMLLDETLRDPDGTTLLHVAASGSDERRLAWLLARPEWRGNPSSLNAQDTAGHTALGFAAGNGHVAAVRALLEAGASGDIKDMFGHDALRTATDRKHHDVVAVLQAATAKSNTNPSQISPVTGGSGGGRDSGGGGGGSRRRRRRRTPVTRSGRATGLQLDSSLFDGLYCNLRPVDDQDAAADDDDDAAAANDGNSRPRVSRLDVVAAAAARRAEDWLRSERPYRSTATGAALEHVRAVRLIRTVAIPICEETGDAGGGKGRQHGGEENRDDVILAVIATPFPAETGVPR